MDVIKRDGTKEPVKFDKISARIKKQTYGLNESYVDYIEVSKKVISGLYDGVRTDELDSLAAETAASMITTHPDYSILASRIAITSLYKNVDKQFSKVAENLFDYINPKTGEKAGMISDEVMEIIRKNAKKLDAMIVSDRDFNFDFFGFKTLERAYLLKINGRIAETPQHMYMRVSVGIWKDNLDMVQKTYDMMSQGLFTHATPTLFNSGTKRPQMSSCFLIDVDDDSIPGIYKTLSDSAIISQNAGGIGINIHKIRAKGSYIKGTNGTSNGIIPMLRVFNETARYVDQCFVPNTKIKTINDLKEICEINSFDSVLTSDGTYKKVIENKIYKNKNETIVNIKTKKGENSVSKNHLFLVVENGKDCENLLDKIKTGVVIPRWIEAHKITEKDLLINLK